ncbi:hypothetical protein M422DRAFT_248186 [Sphaerobolus stellatus SS14]|uniref:BTB domain-containing protein n=1 Tax=Sphaerobolus stellatus (strain SS14) TaxID=990650 RepID=A0A0C9W605_SPHS4|nr:hypothetical protein M422DRAFT_248186 [Sphaerobolus stellatus SS14]
MSSYLVAQSQPPLLQPERVVYFLLKMAPKRAPSKERRTASTSTQSVEDIPHAKRVHTGTDEHSDSNNQQLSFKKNSRFYLTEPIIILFMEDTGFRVNSDLLARRSELFATMLSLPKMSSQDEMADGCSVVRLQDKKADWEEFLEVFYGERYVPSGF